jgi:glycosyltransferase involved in cell wall biosynthesis
MTRATVIISCFDQSRHLERAIDSVLAQTHRDLEVIVVNDGSTDETEEIVSRFGENRAVQYIRQENHGPPAARNAGLALAVGEYVSFLDACDWMHPEKLARQAAILDTNPSIDLVYCDVVPVDDEGLPLQDLSPSAEGRRQLNGSLVATLLFGEYFPSHTVLARRRRIEDAGSLDESLGLEADYDLWLRLAARGSRAHFLDEKLASHHDRSTEASAGRAQRRNMRRRSLAKLAAIHPGSFGAAVIALQDHARELHEANRWLRGRWEEVLSVVRGPDRRGP